MLRVPAAHLLEVGAAVHAAGDLHAETVHHEGRGKNAGDAERDSAGLNHPVADAQVAMTLVERGVDLDPVMAGIVRVGLAASDAGSAGLHAPAATVVPHGHAAVRLRLRSAAAKRVQAVSLGLFLGAELVHELAVLEVAAALAVVVDRLVEDAGRLVLAVERGNNNIIYFLCQSLFCTSFVLGRKNSKRNLHNEYLLSFVISYGSFYIATDRYR